MSCGDVASAFVLEGLVLPPNACFHTNIRANSALALRSVANVLIAKECVTLILSKILRDALSVVYCTCVTSLELHFAGIGAVCNSTQNAGAEL